MNGYEDKLQEVQILEQAFQNILMQKQAFQIELTENLSALKEINKSDDEVFKIIGQLLIKMEKSKIREELENKSKILALRVKSLESHESSLVEKLERLKKNFLQEDKK